MKRLSILVIILGLLSSCSFKGVNKPKNSFNDIVGTYVFIKDSLETPNSKFSEKITLHSDGSFIYNYKIGGFIDKNILGNWNYSDSNIFLNSYGLKRDTIKKVQCPQSIDSKSLYFKVRDLKDYKLNYLMIVNNSNIIREQYDNTILKKSEDEIKTIQIITSSGLYSDILKLPQGNCFKVNISDVRFFNNEKWFFDKTKIRPIGINKNPANYFLYKMLEK